VIRARRARIGPALAGSLIAACSGSEVPIEPVTPGSPALEISVRASPTPFIQGDSTEITVTLRNVSSRAVRVNFFDTCTIVYAIRTTAGALVVPGGGGWTCDPFASRIDLDRLEATQRTFLWRGEGVPAGEYVVYGALGGDMLVVSTGVNVTVTARPPTTP
jgi:hypothetical protein